MKSFHICPLLLLLGLVVPSAGWAQSCQKLIPPPPLPVSVNPPPPFHPSSGTPPPPGVSCGTCTIGNTCSDGTIYAGLSPDGNVPMYTTPCDAGQTLSGNCSGSRQSYTWNNGTGNWTTTGFTSTVTGRANTTGLVSLSDAGSPYAAAVYCKGLTTGGHNDWYLPAKDELNVMYTNYVAIGGFEVGWGTYYWSATELTWDGSSQQRFTDGAKPNHGKNVGSNVRCVRR